jgi:hypothetical protein
VACENIEEVAIVQMVEGFVGSKSFEYSSTCNDKSLEGFEWGCGIYDL